MLDSQALQHAVARSIYNNVCCTVQVLITAVLLLGWMYPIRDNYDIVEYYAGEARVARTARVAGYNAAALDLTYHANREVFDMLSAAGFGLRSCMGFQTTCLALVLLGHRAHEDVFFPRG